MLVATRRVAAAARRRRGSCKKNEDNDILGRPDLEKDQRVGGPEA